MTLLWFVLGILLALGIARYNESNKLFWWLAVPFVLCYAMTVMIQRISHGDERSSDNLVQVVYPTQTQTVVSSNSLAYLLTDSTIAPTKVTALKSVVQDYIPEEHKTAANPSMVFGGIRDQPIQTITQPPECLTKVISTHHNAK